MHNAEFSDTGSANATDDVRWAKARQPEPGSGDKMLPGLVDRYRALVTDLGNNLSTADIPAARTELEKLLGEIEVQTSELPGGLPAPSVPAPPLRIRAPAA